MKNLPLNCSRLEILLFSKNKWWTCVFPTEMEELIPRKVLEIANVLAGFLMMMPF
mgnify:CR=1 FL=1